MSKLSQKQQEIYDYILSFAQENGYPPSVREIAQHVGLKSPSTVHFHLKGLREAGLISQAEGKTRAITITDGCHNRRTRCLWWARWPPAAPSWPRSASRTI